MRVCYCSEPQHLELIRVSVIFSSDNRRPLYFKLYTSKSAKSFEYECDVSNINVTEK